MANDTSLFQGEANEPIDHSSMHRFYKIRIIGTVMVVERLPAPKMRLLISLDKNIPEISRILLLDKCSADLIARTIKKVSSFLVQYSKRNMNERIAGQ